MFKIVRSNTGRKLFRTPTGGFEPITPDMIPNPALADKARRNAWAENKIVRVAKEESALRLAEMKKRLGMTAKNAVLICERCDGEVTDLDFMILPDGSPAHRYECNGAQENVPIA